MSRIWVALLATLALTPAAQAHQPEIVGRATLVHVGDPEVSRAYYGHLPGQPTRYVIVSARPFALYTQITVPDVRGALRDYRVEIFGPAGRLAVLSTPPRRWKKFFEPFGGDHYLTGAEFRRSVAAGRYVVEVSRPGNVGTYALAIGEQERWGPLAAVRALAALPVIKRDYFGESTARAWLSRTVPAVLIAVVAIALPVLALARRRRPRSVANAERLRTWRRR